MPTAKRRVDRAGAEVIYPDYEDAAFRQMRDLLVALKSDYKERDLLLDQMEQYWSMIPMEPIPQDTEDTAVTYDTDTTNRLIGAHRLLTATSPEFSVPTDKNDADAVQISSPLERLAKTIWSASGKIVGMPLEKDAVLSALQAGQVDIALTNLLEDDETEEPAGDEENVAFWRRQNAKARTPILMEVWNPRHGYPLRAKFGLQTYIRSYETTVARFREEWGDVAGIEFILGKRALTRIVVNDGINEQFRFAWIGGDKRPFYAYENKKGIVPVVSQIADGSLFYSKPELQTRPFLYTIHKSNIPNRQSLALTAIFTIIKAIAMSAMWKHGRPPGDPGKTLQVRAVGPLSVFELDPGETIEPMLSKGVIDPSILTALQLGSSKIGESTIYSQALGEPLGANAPFSMVALLHQAGRLPLTAPKILTGWAIASATELAMLWLKASGKKVSAKPGTGEKMIEVNAADIPVDIQFDVSLDIDLPQDMRETASIISGLGGEEASVSRRWIREHLLRGVGQSEAMQEEIWSEKMADLMAQNTFQMFQAIAQMAPDQTLTSGGGNETVPSGQEGQMVQESTPGQGEIAPTGERPVPPRPPMTPRQ